MRERILTAIDMGSTNVTVVVARIMGRTTEIIGSGLSSSHGIKRGVVVDMEAASAAIIEAVAMAEESAGQRIKSAYISVTGEHISSRDSFGVVGVGDGEVSEDDIDNVLECAGTVRVAEDTEILHVVPTDFSIDGQSGIVKPLGMSGVRLESNVQLITASHTAIENLTRCCQKAGVRVLDVIFEALASAKAVVKPYEMQAGVAVIDIGGGTTDVAVFKSDGLCTTSVLPIGGDHMTADLAIGLKVSYEEAERVKQEYGYAIGSPLGPHEMEITSMDGTVSRVRRANLGEILLPRCEEVFDMVHDEIKNELVDTAASCVVLTGGASFLHGIDRVAEAKIGLPVRMGLPESVSSVSEKDVLKNPAFATAVGLLLYGAEDGNQRGSGLADEIRAMFDRLFGGLPRGGAPKRQSKSEIQMNTTIKI